MQSPVSGQVRISDMEKNLVKAAKSGQVNRTGNVHYRVNQTEDGQMSLMLAVDFERAPTPDHTYVADFVEVSKAESDVLIVLGKIDLPSGKRLRNKIEIYFPFHPFVYQLWKSSRKFHEMIRNSVPVKSPSLTQRDIASDTERVQTMTANNALMVRVGGQSMVDFFLISAKDMWVRTKKGDPLNMEALVRVYTNDRLLLRLLDACDTIAKGLIEELNLTITEGDDENLEYV